MKKCQASSSLRVERLGASRGNFRRGMPIGQGAWLSASAMPRNTSRPLLKVSSRRGLLASSTSRPAFSSALRSGPSNFLQKFDSSLPSLVSNTSSHRLPAYRVAGQGLQQHADAIGLRRLQVIAAGPLAREDQPVETLALHQALGTAGLQAGEFGMGTVRLGLGIAGHAPGARPGR